jgi:hypothetical protein
MKLWRVNEGDTIQVNRGKEGLEFSTTAADSPAGA